MKKAELLNNVSRSFHKVGFQMKKHSPAILVGVGIVGVVTSTVMACKATLKVNDILSETKEHVDKIHTCLEDKELVESGEYTEKDGKKDLTTVYVQTGFKFVKLYGPSVVVGGLSIASILASYKIMNSRNLAITAAYTVVDKGFKDYRKRVKERFGEKVDHELKHNIKAETVETMEVDENGKEKTGVKTVETAEINIDSDYARFFDEGSRYWEKDAEYNLMFLKQQQHWANQKLQARGYLFLNEVYEMLDIPATRAGQQVGWVYDEKNPVGDNYVDFGIYDVRNRAKRDFVNGHERSILLDFNVDGNILNLMK